MQQAKCNADIDTISIDTLRSAKNYHDNDNAIEKFKNNSKHPNLFWHITIAMITPTKLFMKLTLQAQYFLSHN